MPDDSGPTRAPRSQRPNFAAEYGIDPSPDGLLPWSWALEQLRSARNYWVCTASPSGRPSAAPVWGIVIEDTLYFSTDTRSAKGRNLLATGRIVVHLESGDEVVMLEGTVDRFHAVEQVPRLAELYQEKYGIDVTTLPSDDSIWFALRPATGHGWREVDFPSSATRWTFSQAG
ncbi:MAG: pyridoxamine 5'-phosphate oxidase family protein [Chloroflexota bacterium]